FGITDWGVTVRGTIGMELPCFGIPVLTAGTGRYSHRGFTEDSATADEYLERLRTVDGIPRLQESRVRLAVLHAFAVFRGRPARYDQVFIETEGANMLERDLQCSTAAATLHDAIAVLQWTKIIDFLTARETKDFFDASEFSGA
ncbi:MAG TPA: hypothetical protein VK629_07720, partial [Steroidobacteraceae bacterium]|nr:hypothetical protein [Steroidobacteraceae bacterium]